MDRAPVHRRGGDLVDDGADVVPGELGGAEPLLEDWAGVFPVVPPGFGFGEPGFDVLIDLRVQRRPDRGRPQGEQVAGSAGPVLGVADLLGGRQVRIVAAHDGLDHRFGGRLLIGRMAGWRGVPGDDVGGVGLPAPGQPDVQGPAGQGAGDQQVGGVHGPALPDVGVARVVQLGAVRQVRPGDQERAGPGPVELPAPHLGVGPVPSGDLERVPVGQLPAARIDLRVEPGPDQVAGTGLVAVRQRGLRPLDGPSWISLAWTLRDSSAASLLDPASSRTFLPRRWSASHIAAARSMAASWSAPRILPCRS